MKLKYLLPVATFASIATIVTPLVTSCGKNEGGDTPPEEQWDASWTKGSVYTPLTPKAAHQFDSANERTVSYINDVSNNKPIYSDDMVYYFYKLATGPDKEYYDIRKLCITLTDIKNITPSNAPSTRFSVSFKMYMDASIKVADLGDQILEFDKREATIQDLPMLLYDEGDKVRCGIGGGYMDDTTWKMNMPQIKVEVTTNKMPTVSIGEENVEYTSTIVNDDELLAPIFPGLVEKMFEFYTNYYSQQTVVV